MDLAETSDITDQSNHFYRLPKESVVKIFEHVKDLKTLINLRMVSKKFSKIAKGCLVVKVVDCRDQYDVTIPILLTFLRPVADKVDTLNLNDCYWMRHKDFKFLLMCTNLRSLHMRQINIQMDSLCQIMPQLPLLSELTFSIVDIDILQIRLAADRAALQAFTRLEYLGLHFRNHLFYQKNDTRVHSKKTSKQTFLKDCSKLRELHISGSPILAEPQVRCLHTPEFPTANQLTEIKVLTLRAGNDPVVRTFFFEILRHLCNNLTRFTTLLQPFVKRDGLWQVEEYKVAMQDVEQLVHLDMAKFYLLIPHPQLNILSAYNIRYLNVSGNKLVYSSTLIELARCCPKLNSLNLQKCVNITKDNSNPRGPPVEDKDLIGLYTLITQSECLRSLNICDVHIHPDYTDQTRFRNLAYLLSLNHRWQHLAVSACCLYAKDTADSFILVRPETDFERLVRMTPHMETFELNCMGFKSPLIVEADPLKITDYVPCNVLLSITGDDLRKVAQWSNLKKLQLIGISGVKACDCLPIIARECKSLKSLSFSCTIDFVFFSYREWLFHSVPYYLELQDLRLEHPHLVLDAEFFNSLASCPKLTRLCIITEMVVTDVSIVKNFIEAKPGLVNFQLFSYLAFEACKELQAYFVHTYMFSRPQLKVCIQSLLSGVVDIKGIRHMLPDQHIEDMTFLTSSVSTLPLSMKH